MNRRIKNVLFHYQPGPGWTFKLRKMSGKKSWCIFCLFFSSHKNRTNSNAYESLCYCHMTSSWSDVQIHQFLEDFQIFPMLLKECTSHLSHWRCICVRMVIFVGKLSWHQSVVMHGGCSLPEWASPRNLHSNAKWCQREGPSSSWGQIPRETWWVSLVWLLSSVLSLHALFHGWCFFFFFLDTGLQGEMKLTFLQSFFF